MGDDHQLGNRLVFEEGREGSVDVADIGSGVGEGALDDTFDNIEGDAVGRVVDAEDGAAESEGETLEVGLHPVRP